MNQENNDGLRFVHCTSLIRKLVNLVPRVFPLPDPLSERNTRKMTVMGYLPNEGSRRLDIFAFFGSRRCRNLSDVKKKRRKRLMLNHIERTNLLNAVLNK